MATGATLPERNLRIITGFFAAFVAFIHIGHPQLGLPRLIRHIQVGTFFDPRPLVFTLAGIAIFVGLILAYNGLYERELYALGVVLMIVFIVGYGLWHTVLDHGGFWPHIHGHSHDDQFWVVTIAVHLVGDPIALLSKISEVIVLIGLIALLRRTP